MGIQASNSRAGVAKDQLIFIIICSVALAVAAVALLTFFSGGGRKTVASEWQCLDCDKTFTLKQTQPGAVTCKCGGEAACLVYRDCASCNKKVLVYRVRMPEQPEGAGGPGGPPGMGMMGMAPTEMQFRIQLEDGTYDWSDWMSSASPELQQVLANMLCPECGQSMSSTPGGRR